MIKRLIYWIRHNHYCDKCCLFCEFFDKCKNDKEMEVDEENDGD